MSKRSNSFKFRALFLSVGAVAIGAPAYGDLSLNITTPASLPATWPNSSGQATNAPPVITSTLGGLNAGGEGAPNNGGQASVPETISALFEAGELFTPTSNFNLGAVSFVMGGATDTTGDSISLHLFQLDANLSAATSYNLSTQQAVGTGDLLGGGNGLAFTFPGAPGGSLVEFDLSNNAAGGGTNDQIPLVAGTSYAIELWLNINAPTIGPVRNSGSNTAADPYAGGGFFAVNNGEDDIFESMSPELRNPIDSPTPRSLLFAIYPSGAVQVPPTWTATGGGSWTNAANWLGGNIPNSVGTPANFGPTILAASTVTLDTAETVGAVNFNSPLSYTLATGTAGVLVLNNGGATASAIVTNTLGSHFISAPIVLNSTGSFVVSNATGSLTLSGNISGSTFMASGAGTIVLSGTNTWAGGGTQIASGTVRLAGNSALPTGAPVNLQTGGTLDLNGHNATVSTLFGDGIIDNVAGGGTSVLTNGSSGNSTFSGIIMNSTGSVGINYAGAGTLTLAPRTRGSLTTNSYSGGTTISSGAVVIGNTGGLPVGGSVLDNGLLSIESGSTAIVAGKITGSGALQVGNTVDGSAGSLQLATGSGAHTLGAITVAAGSTLDITNNRVVLNYGASDPEAAIVADLASGYNGGTWTGAGILSSTAAINPSKFSIGYIDGNVPTDTLGKTVSANQLKIAYTLAGDAFLEGSVGFDDLVSVAQNFGKTGEDWAGGNFNYDPNGSVGFADLVSVAQNFGATTGINQGAGGSGLSPAWQIASLQSTSALPEPASAALLIGAAGLLARRRTRRNAGK